MEPNLMDSFIEILHWSHCKVKINFASFYNTSYEIFLAFPLYKLRLKCQEKTFLRLHFILKSDYMNTN